MTDRPTPYDLVFAELGPARFPGLDAAIVAAGHDPRDRQGFVLVREVVELLRELRPDEGVGEGVDELVAFLHAAFVFWRDGCSVVELDRAALDRAIEGGGTTSEVTAAGRSYYLQLPIQRVWGEPMAGRPPEPLDGWFRTVGPKGAEGLAVFGLHPGRAGFTAVQVGGPRPGPLARADGTPLFAPRLAGGGEAGLHSVAGAEELVELVYRGHALLGPAGPAPGRHRLTSA